MCTGVQLIFSVLKSLTGQPVTVELKNDLSVSGTLRSVDQWVLHCYCGTSSYSNKLVRTPSQCEADHPSVLCRFLNIKLDGITVQQPERYPHLVGLLGGPAIRSDRLLLLTASRVA